MLGRVNEMKNERFQQYLLSKNDLFYDVHSFNFDLTHVWHTVTIHTAT